MMILYNVTVQLEEKVEEDWLAWMRSTHIPEVMETGLFLSHRLCRMINHNAEDAGVTYCVQYFAKDMANLHKYQVKYAPTLQKAHSERYSGKYVVFRTLLEVVE